MQALHTLAPATRFEIFSLVPRWFFADSLDCPFAYHRLAADIGLVQTGPFVEDPRATLRRLTAFAPFRPARVEALARTLEALACRLVLCDIAPLGIAAARGAGLPSVLVENFTWDWIYEAYLDRLPGYAAVIATLAETFASATATVQTEPVCRADARFPLVPPVSRAPRTPARAVRQRLEIEEGVPVVLLTMGGVAWRPAWLRRLEEARGAVFVVPGAAARRERRGALLALPHRSGFFHPDLVHASDAVVGKLGYSTVAEVYAAGVPFAFLQRATFRESQALAAFAERRLPSLALTAEELESGAWLARLPALLAMPRPAGARSNGATAAARLALALLDRV